MPQSRILRLAMLLSFAVLVIGIVTAVFHRGMGRFWFDTLICLLVTVPIVLWPRRTQ